MIGQYKGLYHSALVKNGPVIVTIKSDILQSKYPNKPDYVVIEHQGDEQSLSIESPAVADALRGLKGQTVTLTAHGSRDDATMDVAEAGGTPAPRQPARQPQRREESRIILTDDPEKAVDTLQDGLAQFANAAYLAMSTINNLREQAKINGIEMTSEQFQALTSTALISLKDQIHNLPTAPVWRTK